jgi:phosphatidylinositol alpha-mannosyltransferase
MKIALLTPYFYPVVGGITSHVNNLYNELKTRARIQVKIITKEGKNAEDVIPVDSSKYSFIQKTHKILKKEKPDAIHAHSHWYVLSPAIRYKKDNPGTKVVFTFHTKPTKPFTAIRRRIFERMLSKCDTIIFVSNSLKDLMEDYLRINAEKKVIIAGGFKKEKLKFEDKKIETISKYGLTGCEPILVSIGNFTWPEKAEGLKRLILAVRTAKKEFPKIKAIIAGSGNFLDDIRNFSKEMGTEQEIIFTGTVSDLRPIYSIADIYAHISFQDAMPNALLEAMSYGKPLIATSEGGIKEVIENGHNGLLVKGDAEHIANLIIELFKDKEKMKKLGQNASYAIQDKYSWDRAIEEYIDTYRGIQ